MVYVLISLVLASNIQESKNIPIWQVKKVKPKEKKTAQGMKRKEIFKFQ
jgi:hypothetical protein